MGGENRTESIGSNGSKTLWTVPTNRKNGCFTLYLDYNKFRKLSLSTNCIEKISNLNGLKNLKILSLGRNNIKNLTGLEPVGDTLEQLWISYNSIEKMKGINVLKKLKVLYMSNNFVKDWSEFQKLADLPVLEDLLFVGNPLEENSGDNWREEACKRLPKLKKLDGVPVLHDEGDDEG
ncbi:unnamed protein product [Schistosoma rodhaini]|nr:unnamed protein product [Schistosoma rodhaini]